MKNHEKTDNFPQNDSPDIPRMNGFTIMPDGRLMRCTVALYNNKNIVGKLSTDGSLGIDREKALWWSRGLFSGNPDELACPLRAISTSSR